MTEIKISELSIGDWIEVDGAAKKVWYLSKQDEINDTTNDYWVKPIPLTPAILEKNGFVKRSEYRWSNPSIGCACLRLGTKYWDIRIGGRNRAYRPTRISIDNIVHTHQLQHALRLAGVGKEIEL